MLGMRNCSVLPSRRLALSHFFSNPATSLPEDCILVHANRRGRLCFFNRLAHLAGACQWKHEEDRCFQHVWRRKSMPTCAGVIQLSDRQRSPSGAKSWNTDTPKVVIEKGHPVHLENKSSVRVTRFVHTAAHASSEAMVQLITHRREQPARVRVRGLPFRAHPKDVADFFTGYQLAGSPEEAVQLQCGLNGRPSGYAFVYFATEAEARRARDEKNRCYIGDRFIEIFVDTETGEMEWLYQKELSENVNRKQHGKDNR